MVVNKTIEIHTLQQLSSSCDQCPQQNAKLAACLSYGCGLRRFEVTGLTHYSVDTRPEKSQRNPMGSGRIRSMAKLLLRQNHSLARSFVSIKEQPTVGLYRIAIDPTVMNGQPYVYGLLLTVLRVLELVALHPDRGRSCLLSGRIDYFTS